MRTDIVSRSVVYIRSLESSSLALLQRYGMRLLQQYTHPTLRGGALFVSMPYYGHGKSATSHGYRWTGRHF